MTIEEKKDFLKEYCSHKECNECALSFRRAGDCYSINNDRYIEENYKLVVEDMSKIEEKKKAIEKYCDKHICHICALRDFHLDDVCYHEKNCKRIDEMYNEIINEGVVKELKKRKKDAEIKEPTIMQERVAIPVDKGTMTVKGTCYEDVLNILCRNGYATNMHTEPCKKNLGEIEHTIVFWKDDVSDNPFQE